MRRKIDLKRNMKRNKKYLDLGENEILSSVSCLNFCSDQITLKSNLNPKTLDSLSFFGSHLDWCAHHADWLESMMLVRSQLYLSSI